VLSAGTICIIFIYDELQHFGRLPYNIEGDQLANVYYHLYIVILGNHARISHAIYRCLITDND
jgi:hypothetical protein